MHEVNFDGIVGPTHNYAGLAFGNLASKANALTCSNPKQAAKQGLKKMQLLLDLGLMQGVLPPQERPNIEILRQLGFTGQRKHRLTQAARRAPEIFQACCSASAMWTANAATVSCSANTADGRVHITPANLQNQFHRSQESQTTKRALKAIFPNEHFFLHHEPLPAHAVFGDEGAANHMYLSKAPSMSGLEVFVFGRSELRPELKQPTRYPARQTLEASQSVARLHGLEDDVALFVQQNPNVIDQGVFHNDVIAVSHLNVLLCHEYAFVEQASFYHRLKSHFSDATPLHIIEVPEARLHVADAVQSYLFNSQIVSLPDQDMALIAPIECQENAAVSCLIDEILSDSGHPLNYVHFVDLRQSMNNGGGPACLRLRVPLTQEECQHMNQDCLITAQKLKVLDTWIEKHYRDQLLLDDLADPQLLEESYCALDELTQLLKLGSIYDFQRL